VVGRLVDSANALSASSPHLKDQENLIRFGELLLVSLVWLQCDTHPVCRAVLP
jgi:hypothetical protein